MRTALFASIIFVVGFLSCTKNSTMVDNSSPAFLDTLSFSHSMKGWELYSWPNGNEWNYSVLKGTNRGKSYSEITTNKILVVGKSPLKTLLAKLPANEEIFWRGKGWLENTETVSLPDENTISELQEFCSLKSLSLHIIK